MKSTKLTLISVTILALLLGASTFLIIGASTPSSDPLTGYWNNIAESIIPTPPAGAGDAVSAAVPNLVTLKVTSKSDTQPCLIDIVSAYYKTSDGYVGPVDIVVDGYYGGPPPRTMSYQGSLLPPGDPTGTTWHELYPQYCNYWDLVGWTDNGDGDLTASDQITMTNETGWTYQFHVDQVTVTIHWTFKPDEVNPTGVEAGAEPNQPLDSPITDPIGTTWHQIYPPDDYCKEFVISLIFTIGLMTAINPAKSPTTYVKIYVDQPLGYIPFETPGDNKAVVIPIKIETSGISDGYPAGIVGWGVNVRVDPNVLDINTVAGSPPPFPPPPAAASIEGGALAGYFLYEYSLMMSLSAPTFMGGSSDPTTGYWKDIAETFMPNPGHGAGDYVSGLYPKLATLYVTSKSDTQSCVIDLVSGFYKDGNGNVYPADILVDGYYGAPPPRTMSYQGSLLPPGDPTNTTWHELYPQYCKMWDLVDWTDNGDGDLTASDQIDMVNEAGYIYHFHVDVVTTTIHWTFKPDEVNPTGVEAGAEPNQLLDSPITDPIGTTWHQIYPPEDYCKEFVITSWIDNDENGVFNPSDQFDFEYFGEGATHWAHLDDITTDIIVSQKGEPEEPTPEFPLGLEIMMMLAAAIPIVYVWRTRKWSGKK